MGLPKIHYRPLMTIQTGKRSDTPIFCVPVDSASHGAARHAWRTPGGPGSLPTRGSHGSEELALSPEIPDRRAKREWGKWQISIVASRCPRRLWV